MRRRSGRPSRKSPGPSASAAWPDSSTTLGPSGRARSSSSRIDEFRAQLEVNLVGHLAVIQAFLPLIRRGGGRIVNVGSIGGKLVLPIHGAYSASKFGMEALSDALRLELRQWRIPVSLIEPGATNTAIFGKTLTRLDAAVAALDARGEHRYDAQFAAMRGVVEKTAADGAPAEELAKAIAEALMATRPKARYLAGKGAQGGGRPGPHAIRPHQGPGHRQGRRPARSGVMAGWTLRPGRLSRGSIPSG